MKDSSNGRHRKNGTETMSLEARVVQLEADVARLKQAPAAVAPGGWESIVGIDQGNPFFKEMVKAMKRHRDEDYAQARGKTRVRKRRRAAVTAK